MRFFADDSFQFQFLRTLGHTYGQAADVGECLETAARITSGDEASWYHAWKATGDRVYAIAEQCAAAGHRASAGEAYVRASNYFRTAVLYNHAGVDDPDTLTTARASRDSYQRALPFLAIRVEHVEIPYEQASIPGYVLTPSVGTGRRPTLILNPGFDGVAEELAMGYGAAAVARGYTCVAFEGPGQGRVLREQRLPFRADWHRVVGPVVDYALSRDDVDPRRVALMGISFGGNLAPRAAAHEHRLAALIANSGVLSFYDPILLRMRMDPKTTELAAVEAMIRGASATRPGARAMLRNAPFVMGAPTFAEALQAIRTFDITDADQIRCQTLVTDCEREELTPAQARPFYDRLTCPKTYMMFTEAEGAPVHCQIGAEAVSSQRIFDWLDAAFASVGG